MEQVAAAPRLRYRTFPRFPGRPAGRHLISGDNALRALPGTHEANRETYS